MRIAPSTYYAAIARPPSARALRDEQLKKEIVRVYEENYSVFGAEKVWWALNREGIRVGRYRVERLTRTVGLAGAGEEGAHDRARPGWCLGPRPGETSVHRGCAEPVVGG
ncbi:MAG: IS3 family transposase [Pseudonocardiaceae bacterium]